MFQPTKKMLQRRIPINKKKLKPFKSEFFTGRTPAQVLKICAAIYYQFQTGHPTDKLAEAWDLETGHVEHIIREINTIKGGGPA